MKSVSPLNQASSDLEAKRQPKENLEGYADFSKYIASDDDLFIFRRFGGLGARNLLCLQAELQMLEAQLYEIDEEDRKELETLPDESKKKIRYPAKSWESFQVEARQEGRQKRKMDIILRLRCLMKEYEESLLRRNQVLALHQPRGGALKAFTSWFRQRQPLLGTGWNLLDDETDLIGLKTEDNPDRMSRLISYLFGYMIRERYHEHPESWGPVYYFPQARVTWIVSILSVIMAGILLVGAIVTLYHIHAPGHRLGIAGVFTGLFAASISILTNARRTEIFSATAAYAAVLVVYLSAPTAADN